MKNYTDITVLVDRSGSMKQIKNAMESGFDEFLMQHQANPKTRLTLIQFDGQNSQEVIYTATPIKEAARLNLQPRGWTPLFDALCTAIDNTGSRLSAMREADRPNRVLFVIITDGLENASTSFKRADVRQRIEKQNGTYNWQFVYLGANQDAFAEAESFGIPQAMAANFAYSHRGAAAGIRGMTSNTVAYSNTGDANNLKFTKKQREEAEEKTPASTS